MRAPRGKKSTTWIALEAQIERLWVDHFDGTRVTLNVQLSGCEYRRSTCGGTSATSRCVRPMHAAAVVARGRGNGLLALPHRLRTTRRPRFAALGDCFESVDAFVQRACIDEFYNTRRRHSYLGYLSPSSSN
uniref:hypothetical protein n=1 Tax=Sandaracinus sp. TaxID=2024858 RepID=UPI0019D4C507|nr:hypothetical protein [Sandaracinus sp.]